MLTTLFFYTIIASLINVALVFTEVKTKASTSTDRRMQLGFALVCGSFLLPMKLLFLFGLGPAALALQIAESRTFQPVPSSPSTDAQES